MRNDWGHKITELIKPGGYLVALIFPLDSPSDRGPPFFVQLEHYLEVLGQGWEMIVDEVPKTSYKTHVGRERLVVWKRA